MKKLLTLAFFVLLQQYVWSQCTVTSTTYPGYSVTVSITPKAIVAPPSCPNGYNYNVRMDYSITFTGSPRAIYTLQGNITCGSQSLFYTIPTSPTSGTLTTTVNPYRTISDCAIATISLLGCNSNTITIEGDGIPSQTISPCPILPVELAYFKASPTNNKLVNLSWQTAVELNNDFFTVESSKDGSDWLELARIKGAGSSINVQNYNFVDERPRSAIAYYRLKQTDFDGKFAYSKVIAVNVDGFQNPEVNVYPNPTSNQVTIEGDEDELDELRLYNLLGQDITASIKNLSSTELKRVLDLSNLNTGTYFIKTKTTAKKVTKQ